MKILYIPAKSKLDIKHLLDRIQIKGKIGIITTTQFTEQAKEINKNLKDSIYAGTILGCNISNAEKIKGKIDSFLYIGTGKFHPIEVACKLNKPVYILNPLTEEFSMISEDEIKKRKLQKRGKEILFLNSKNLGILVSIKPGQENLKLALSLSKKLNAKIFLFNTLKLEELENFPEIDCWINTACTRIEYRKVINYRDVVPNLLKSYNKCNA